MRGQNKKGPGRGHLRGQHIRFVLQFDLEMFEEVRAKALRDETTTAEAIRTLIQWGLMAEEDRNG